MPNFDWANGVGVGVGVRCAVMESVDRKAVAVAVDLFGIAEMRLSR